MLGAKVNVFAVELEHRSLFAKGSRESHHDQQSLELHKSLCACIEFITIILDGFSNANSTLYAHCGSRQRF